MHPASAFPGQAPYYPEQNMMALVTRQLEYYFSIENLLKDEWLRGHMDSQGFVLFDVIADFKRMKAMTQDKNLILAACEGSAEIELVVGNDDGRERIRRRHGWEKWVYPLGSRHAGANYDQGPNGYHVRNFYPYQPPMMPPYAMESPSVFSPNGFDAHFSPYMNMGMYGYGNGMGNGVNGHAATPRDSQLSAAVPEFSPAAGPSGSDLERGTHAEGPKGAPTSGDVHGNDAGNAVTLNGDAPPTTNGSHEGSSATEIVQPYTNGIGGDHEAEGH
jgi:la-related protein 1